MPLVKVNMKLKSDNLGIAMTLKKLRSRTKKLPSQIVNQACFSIANRAFKTMQVVSIARIDAELDAAADIKFTHTDASGKKTKGTHQPGVTVGQMIILARLSPNSRYSQLTGNVWPLSRPNFGSRRDSSSAFWGWVGQALARMRSARHSSIGFYKLSANVVKMIFIGEIYDQGPGAAIIDEITGQASAGTLKVSREIGRLAGGKVARGDSINARASFWVTATEPETKGTKEKSLNSVAQRFWQDAVDDEAESILEKVNQTYVSAARAAGIKVVA